MYTKYFLILATCIYAAETFSATSSSKTPVSEAVSNDDLNLPHPDLSSSAPAHLEHDAHKDDGEERNKSTETENKEEENHEENENKPEDKRDQPTPTSPAEEPESKELQQEKALYELNAYFDDYLCPRPFIIGSTEF